MTTQMSTPVKLAGFLLALVAVFIVARGVGAAIDPVFSSDTHDTHESRGGHP